MMINCDKKSSPKVSAMSVFEVALLSAPTMFKCVGDFGFPEIFLTILTNFLIGVL